MDEPLPPTPPEQGADLLAGVMRDRDLSQGDVANDTGLSQSTVSRILNGRPPSRACAVLLQAKYGIPVTAWPVHEHKNRGRKGKRGPRLKKPAPKPRRKAPVTKAAA